MDYLLHRSTCKDLTGGRLTIEEELLLVKSINVMVFLANKKHKHCNTLLDFRTNVNISVPIAWKALPAHYTVPSSFLCGGHHGTHAKLYRRSDADILDVIIRVAGRYILPLVW